MCREVSYAAVGEAVARARRRRFPRRHAIRHEAKAARLNSHMGTTELMSQPE